MEPSSIESAPGAPLVVSADTVYGWEVTDRAGRVLGTVSHLLFDLTGGTIAAAVVASGGFLGVGESSFTLPWSGLSALDGGRRGLRWNGGGP